MNREADLKIIICGLYLIVGLCLTMQRGIRKFIYYKLYYITRSLLQNIIFAFGEPFERYKSGGLLAQKQLSYGHFSIFGILACVQLSDLEIFLKTGAATSPHILYKKLGPHSACHYP